jgi:Domain of unknown function (DUF6852)/Domain of unknown function (DUF5606)
MTLDKIIAIAGKPGLYKVLTHTKGRIIVESLTDKKRFPVGATQTINALQDIAIYTYDEEVPLREVLVTIYEKEKGKTSVNPNDKGNVLTKYFSEILPNYDAEHVYTSNIKKLLKWYNDLVAAGFNFENLAKEIAAGKEKEQDN